MAVSKETKEKLQAYESRIANGGTVVSTTGSTTTTSTPGSNYNYKYTDNGTVNTSSTGDGAGYGAGNGYANRESAFTWNDGTTTFSNATNYKDAAKLADKEDVGLSSSVTYLSSGTQKKNGTSFNYNVDADGRTDRQTGFIEDIYSKDSQTGHNYDNALYYENEMRSMYGLDDPEGAYGVGIGGGSNYAGGSNNPYQDMLKYVQGQYDNYEQRIIDMNQSAMVEGERRLENQKGDVNRAYEDNAKQAYVNYLREQHAMPELLSAQGITGGATETAQLSLQNTYQNNLTDINQALAQAIRDIDNSIIELQHSGNLEMARQVLANSQAALSAYQGIMQNYINYNYQLERDMIADQRYQNSYALDQMKYETGVEKAEYDRVLGLINSGFAVENAADILGIEQNDIDTYIAYINNKRQLEQDSIQSTINKNLAAAAKSAASTTSGSSSSASKSATGSTSKTAIKNADGFAQIYNSQGVNLGDYGVVSLAKAVSLYNNGKGLIDAYVNPYDNRIYFKTK